MKNITILLFLTLLYVSLSNPLKTAPNPSSAGDIQKKIIQPLISKIVNSVKVALPKVIQPLKSNLKKPTTKLSKEVLCFNKAQKLRDSCSRKVKKINTISEGIFKLYSKINSYNYTEKMKGIKRLGKSVEKTTKIIQKTAQCVIKRNKWSTICQKRCDQRIFSINQRTQINSKNVVYFKKLLCRDIMKLSTKFNNTAVTIAHNKCEKGEKRNMCPKLFRGCSSYNVPPEQREIVQKLSAYLIRNKSNLKIIKDKSSAVAIDLKKKNDILRAKIQTFVKNSKRELCIRKYTKILSDSKITVQSKLAGIESKDKVTQANIQKEVVEQKKTDLKAEGSLVRCGMKRTKMCLANCKHWSKNAKKFKVAIKNSQEYLLEVTTENESNKDKIVEKVNLQIQRYNKRLTQVLKKVKECQIWVQNKKKCKTCRNECNRTSVHCNQKCYNSATPTGCVKKCRKSKGACHKHCSSQVGCEVNYTAKRCISFCGAKGSCHKKCKTSENRVLCSFQCQDVCVGSCIKDLKKFSAERILYTRCRRFDSQLKYIQFYEKNLKKEKSEGMSEFLKAKYESIKKRQIESKCGPLKESKSCQNVTLYTKCGKEDEIKRQKFLLEIKRKGTLAALKIRVSRDCSLGDKPVAKTTNQIKAPKSAPKCPEARALILLIKNMTTEKTELLKKYRTVPKTNGAAKKTIYKQLAEMKEKIVKNIRDFRTMINKCRNKK